MTSVQKHLGRVLRKLPNMILARYQPTNFATTDEIATPLNMVDLKNASNWEALLSAGVVTAKDTPLTISGLRFSRIFPRHLLYCGPSGRVELIDESRAVTIIAEATYVAWRGLQSERKPSNSSADSIEVASTLERKTQQPVVEHDHK